MTPDRRVVRIDAARALLGDLAEPGALLGPRTTYRVGGPAALLVRAATVADVALAGAASRAAACPVLVVGNGSNLLVADRGFGGLVVVLGEGLADVVVEGETVRCGAAAPLPVVARRTVAEGLTGFEWAVGVPGTIGGAVRMNAGGHGADMAASLEGVRVVDLRTGQDEQVSAAALDLGYRRSAIRPEQVVVEARLGLARGDRDRSEDHLRSIVRWRRDHQPGGANAGSVFANPPGDSAGRLVDAVGAKGLRHGTAEVSTKHANFIQSDPGGAADDVLALMIEVAARVEAATGVRLHPETRLVGFRPDEVPADWLARDPRLLIES